ncbi:hypothetical protein BJX99DRAFT_253601 [Aspergillus californicus]
MAGYLLLFLQPTTDQMEEFPRWRREFFPNHPDITHSVYLDASDAATEENKYRHLNIYRFNRLHRFDESLHDQLHAYYTDPRTAYLHWHVYTSIAETRQPSLSAPTVVTVGMAIPTDAISRELLSEWYSKEHIPALATVRGWQAAFRLQLVSSHDGAVRFTAPYLAIHEWEEPNELGGETWRKAIMTPGTKAIEDLQTAPMQRRVWRLA